MRAGRRIDEADATGMLSLVDLLLAGTLIAVALLTLGVRDLFAAVVLFISNGLLLALAWARLGAPDVAMAEAAIGAGITGALVLAALRRLQTFGSRGDEMGSGGRQGEEGHDGPR